MNAFTSILHCHPTGRPLRIAISSKNILNLLRPVGRDSTTARILDFGVVSFATKTCDLENCLSHGEEKAPVA